MKKVSLKQIEGYNKRFDKNMKRKLMQNVLASTPIDQSVRVASRSVDTQPIFSIDIQTMGAANQKSSGRCWIFAGTNVLREVLGKKINVNDIELSQNFVSFYDRFEKINYLLEAIIELKDAKHDDRTLAHLLQNGVGDGGQWDMFVSIIKKYGVVPKSVYGETYQSSNTRGMNYVINNSIKKFAAFVRKNKDNLEIVAKEKEELLNKLYEFMCTCLGKPTEKFDFEYVDKDNKYHRELDLTPKSFYEKFIGVDLDEYVSVINAPTSDKPYYNNFTVKYLGNVVGGNDIKYLNLPIEELKELCLKQLKDNEPVWFGCDCGKYGDRTTGVWDEESYDYLNAFDIDMKVDKEDMLDYYVSAMNHAMVITGVCLKGEKATKWKIENSWGTEPGNKGYYLMSDSWYDSFVYQIVINKKYLSDKQLKALEKKTIELDPWDPMGTLA